MSDLSVQWHHPYHYATLRGMVLLLVTYLTAARGMSGVAPRINNPCAGGTPAVLVYPVHSMERVFISQQVLQSYYMVSQAINYIDSLLRDYTQLNRVPPSSSSSHCQAPVPCDISFHLRTSNQVSCVRQMYERLAADVTMIEKISAAEADYELIVNTSLSYQMNRLKETMYNLLCDLQNVFEKKRVQLPSMELPQDGSIFLRDLERFQRDYAAFVCIRVSLRQTRDDLRRLETVGFFA